MKTTLPYLLALGCALGWYFAAHPGAAPWSAALARAGVAPTPREAMLRQWGASGFDTTDLGRAWRRLGDSVLRDPSAVTLPSATRTYFARAERPNAAAYAVTVPAGRVLDVRVAAALTSGRAYVELYERRRGPDSALQYRRTFDTGHDTLRDDVDRAREYVFRVEATPLALGNVSLRLGTTPLLSTFPVGGATERDVGSEWGAPRDGGRRRHKGIDIFEARGTPLLAAAAGTVTRVREGGRGGKTVSVRLAGQPLSLYYAHLDTQLTTRGARVRPGDTLGTVGNTGNARTTPPHLHFGVYARGGAVDPLPFVAGAAAPAATPSLGFPLTQDARLSRRAGRGRMSLTAKQYVRPLALADDRTLVELADGRRLWLGRVRLEPPSRVLRTERLARADTLRSGPSAGAPAIGELRAGESVAILAEGAGGGRLVRSGTGVTGWQ